MNSVDDIERVCAAILVILGASLLILVQQSYAKAHDIGVEQPVGYLGIAEYFFRHPERLIGR